jgi:rhizosphere induced protein
MSQQYELIAVNNSPDTATFCLYQFDESATLFPAAWFTKMAAPTSRVYFRWTIDYDFVWGETGQLVPGVIFDSAQIWNANLTTQNKVTLGNEGGAYTFSDLTQGPQSGTLSILCDTTVPMNMLSAGIGMSGSATSVAQAMPNMSFQFTPQPQYRLAFGNFTGGQVLDAETISNPATISFGPSIYSLTATLNADGTWTIAQNPLRTADEGPAPQAQI